MDIQLCAERDGDGGALLPGVVLHDRHVCRKPNIVCVGVGGPAKCSSVRTCGCIRVDLWGRDMVAAISHACPRKSPTANLHEVSLRGQ